MMMLRPDAAGVWCPRGVSVEFYDFQIEVAKFRLYRFGWSFLLVFVDRLILQMRKVDDPGTQVALSTLMFNHGNPARESGDSSDPDGSGESMEAVAAPQDAGGLLSARAAEKRPCDPSLA